MSEIYKVLAKQKKFLQDKGYNVGCIGLYGSQNYGLNDELSDIDVRAIVIPTLDQIINRTKISKKYVTEYGDIDVKDLLTYYEVVRKGNFSFIEPFQSKWFIGDKSIKDLFKNIPINLKAVKGAMLEKAKAFRHEYPSKKEEFIKWGYDPKQLHHIFRLLDLLAEKDNSVSYIDYTDDCMGDVLLDIKRNKNNVIDKMLSIDTTSFETIKQDIVDAIKYGNLIPEDYKYIPVDLSKEISEYLKAHLKLELNNTSVKSARQFRTFGQAIPKKDLQRFSELEQYKGQDISYIVYESVEVL